MPDIMIEVYLNQEKQRAIPCFRVFDGISFS